MGEKVRSMLGRIPAVSVAPCAARTRAPLVATSGGVCSAQRVLPAGRLNSSQNWFGPAAAPVGGVAQVAPLVAVDVIIDSGAGVDASASWCVGAVGAVPPPQAAVS